MQQFRAFVFGHYDSRGGAILVRATNIIEAVQKYSEDVWTMSQFVKLEDQAEWIHSVSSDLIGAVNVVNVSGVPFGNIEEELDADYDGIYHYGYAQYQSKYQSQKSRNWHHVRSGGCDKTLVFWRKKDGVPGFPSLLDNEFYAKTRIKRQKFGEDAFGLSMVP